MVKGVGLIVGLLNVVGDESEEGEERIDDVDDDEDFALEDGSSVV